MKNKKIIILIVSIIIIIGIILFINKTNKTNKTNETVGKTSTEIKYNESDGMYEIRNSNNEVIANSTDEAALQIYIDDPDYNP